MKKVLITLGIMTVVALVFMTVRFDANRTDLNEEITTINDYSVLKPYIHIELEKIFESDTILHEKYTEYTSINIDFETSYLYFERYKRIRYDQEIEKVILEKYLIREESDEIVKYAYNLDETYERIVLFDAVTAENFLEISSGLIPELNMPDFGIVTYAQSMDEYKLHINQFRVRKMVDELDFPFNQNATRYIDLYYSFKPTSYTFEIDFHLYASFIRKELTEYTIINYKEAVNFPNSIYYETI